MNKPKEDLQNKIIIDDVIEDISSENDCSKSVCCVKYFPIPEIESDPKPSHVYIRDNSNTKFHLQHQLDPRENSSNMIIKKVFLLLNQLQKSCGIKKRNSTLPNSKYKKLAQLHQRSYEHFSIPLISNENKFMKKSTEIEHKSIKSKTAINSLQNNGKVIYYLIQEKIEFHIDDKENDAINIKIPIVFF